MALYDGKQKLTFCKRLGNSWHDLADYCDIPTSLRRQYLPGQEAREIWMWLEQREKLPELAEALTFIERQDLVDDVLNHTAAEQSPEQPKTFITSPYPGLRAFTEDEAALFFGREADIESLCQQLSAKRFLAVIGASGSGKSSLVRAGLIPHLQAQQIDWVRFTPGGLGDDPFLALANAFFPALEKARLKLPDVAAQLRQRGNIQDIATHYLTGKSKPKLLLFIDQFEELFTLVADVHKQRFVNVLEKAMQLPQLQIILTVRADFHEQCLHYPALTQLINQGAWHLSTPNRQGLRMMITEPAKAAGLHLEAGLVEQLLDDTGTEPGALALLAFTLEQLAATRTPTNTLALSAYQALGGVHQAIGHHAQQCFEQLEATVQAALPGVFTALVSVDPERGIPTRKRAQLAQLGLPAEAQQLLDAFTDARLLVSSELTLTANQRETVVEVAHEALLTHWDLLKEWIASRFNDFRLLRQVELEAADWERNGRPEINLWPHERLQAVYALQQTLKPKLSAMVTAFIQPEAQRLITKLDDPALSHQQRERIGVRLAEIGDPRPGIGVDVRGIPEVEWCWVPGGQVTLEDDAGSFSVEPFYISRYPTTYQQYRAFLLAADGYQDARWWHDLQRDPQPGGQFRKIANHPAEKVSWFDAVAFCRWLTDKCGFEVRLPTEWEWQQAATGGCPDNLYPWGAFFDAHHCNCYESGLSRTTAVGLYPQGLTLTGVLDMSGNVWEWCLNEYEKPDNSNVSESLRVVRGGSWGRRLFRARSTYRVSFTPDARNYYIGFRLACSSPIISSTAHCLLH